VLGKDLPCWVICSRDGRHRGRIGHPPASGHRRQAGIRRAVEITGANDQVLKATDQVLKATDTGTPAVPGFPVTEPGGLQATNQAGSRADSVGFAAASQQGLGYFR
jgi:hypothetical protein